MFFLQRVTVIMLLNMLMTNCQLYTKNDNVSIFEPQSFNLIFHNKPVDNWFIEFYHSYCGHCINFAPIFKKFIKEAKYWGKIIKFGVVDCSQHKKLCSEQGINYYPYFKIYPNRSFNNSSPTGQLINLAHSDLNEVFDGVIRSVEEHIKPQQLIETRPDSNITKEEHFLVIGGEKLDLKRTMLGFADRLLYPMYYQYKEKKKDFEVAFFNGSSTLLHRFQNMNLLHQWLLFYLIDKSEVKIYTPEEPTVTSPTFIPNKTRSPLLPAVYNQDIYSSIYYSFTNDISDRVLNSVDNVIILKNFVEKLYLYSDISEELTSNFKELMLLLQKKIEHLKSRSKLVMNWSNMLRLSNFAEMEPTWIGCNGSLPHLRRYPCGLWTTFHTLTVNLHMKVTSKEIQNDDSLDLIRSIREFIFTFFACRECAVNFKRETLSYESRVVDSKRAVLYLWQVHNSVNKRLSGAPSEDPLWPKAAFPSERTCPQCRLTLNATWPRLSQWSYPDVLIFLLRHYSPLNRVHYPTQSVLMQHVSTSSGWFLLGPSSLDMGLCVILSVFCLATVLLGFLRFWRRATLCHLRKHRRSPLIQDRS